MGFGLLIAAFGAPSPGVSLHVAYIACLPFILGGMASALHCCGRTSRVAYAFFLSAITILLFATGYGPEPTERACAQWVNSLELPGWSAERCKSVAAACLGTLWLGLGVAFFAYILKPSKD